MYLAVVNVPSINMLRNIKYLRGIAKKLSWCKKLQFHKVECCSVSAFQKLLSNQKSTTD